jgi:hypothetical protein
MLNPFIVFDGTKNLDPKDPQTKNGKVYEWGEGWRLLGAVLPSTLYIKHWFDEVVSI